MAKNDLVRYLLPVNFPDGVRIVEGFTTPDRDVAIQHIRQALETNPDVTFNVEDIQWNVTPEQSESMRAKWAEENPDRVPAREMGLDTGNRLITNPQIARDLAAQKNQT
jgi:hypothetical protein